MMLLNQPIYRCLQHLKNELNVCCRYQHTAIKASTNSLHSIEVKPVFSYANENYDKVCIQDYRGEYNYGSIYNTSANFSKEISKLLDYKPNGRIAFLCGNDSSYVITQWAAWIAGHIVVPLSRNHPESLLEYYVADSNADLIITTSNFAETCNALAKKNDSKLLILDESVIECALNQKEKKKEDGGETLAKERMEMRINAGLEPSFYANSDAMIIYTSGTSGKPKGVVLTHRNISAQVHAMWTAWEWSKKDVMLHVLPLNHVHGIVNALITPLCVGAKVLMLQQFNTQEIWSHLLALKPCSGKRVTVFMGVPTMYIKLIEEYGALFSGNKKQMDFIKNVLSQKVRLMISGSAPLRTATLNRWKEISGHTLLERYGMSETGMVLSNPLLGERKAGFVGQPLPTVNVRIVNRDDPKEVYVEGSSQGSNVIKMPDNVKSITGELLVRGPSVFRAYWNKPNLTSKEFVDGEWFKTGDTAEYDDGWYKILGRSSVDIIKTGGFKVSALEVEGALINHPDVVDVAVVGVPDATWGEKVSAVVTTKDGIKLELSHLREWCKPRLPSYAIPTELKIVGTIPRNQMGKINKKELIRDVFSTKGDIDSE